ncbi:MAG: hypothetical protein GY801_07005 [bacterium]|nr:hypothetical protein [bacterium]
MKIPHFQQCSAAANHIDMARIMRPSWPFLLDELLDLLEQDFHNKGSEKG